MHADGSAKLGAKYLLRKYDSHYVDLAALSEKKASVWTVGAGYEYPFSKRTNLWTYAGYADGAKGCLLYTSGSKSHQRTIQTTTAKQALA